jgi:peptidyl-prolyl cis-trans isomerase B (cyclophilin B)
MNLSIASILCFLALAAPAAPTKSTKPAAPPKKSASAAKTAPAKAPAVPAGNPRVAIDTNKGRIVAELYADKAPKTVKNFLDYVKAGHYNGTIFHRVIPGFMVQGGGFTASLIEKPTRAAIPNEADNKELNQRGTLAMARTSDPNSATAQFFINVANNGFLNFRSKTPDGWGYAVFGNVVEGMDVVDAIAQVPTATKGMLENLPNQPVVIQKVTVLPAAKPAAKLQ